MSTSISAEDQSAYNTLEQQRSTDKGRLIQLQTSALTAKKNKKKSELTLQELNDMIGSNSNVNVSTVKPLVTYQAVGRMYVSQYISITITRLT